MQMGGGGGGVEPAYGQLDEEWMADIDLREQVLNLVRPQGKAGFLSLYDSAFRLQNTVFPSRCCMIRHCMIRHCMIRHCMIRHCMIRHCMNGIA